MIDAGKKSPYPRRLVATAILYWRDDGRDQPVTIVLIAGVFNDMK